mmetsp:Transcript_15553/g.47267  ORF Transcript_15553/g.47267 Transcript_15553/m.47267 type:complete len:118 (+) Transcript_15553:866-1219(+)|eukprot:scaffold81102_cov32-Tisochrysis_lutea.AAC.3
MQNILRVTGLRVKGIAASAFSTRKSGPVLASVIARGSASSVMALLPEELWPPGESGAKADLLSTSSQGAMAPLNAYFGSQPEADVHPSSRSASKSASTISLDRGAPDANGLVSSFEE